MVFGLPKTMNKLTETCNVCGITHDVDLEKLSPDNRLISDDKFHASLFRVLLDLNYFLENIVGLTFLLNYLIFFIT